jgi:hypothetical protein
MPGKILFLFFVQIGEKIMKKKFMAFSQGIKGTSKLVINLAILIVLLVPTVLVLADDGTIFRKNVSATPELESENAALRMLPVYVPAQSSDGTVLTEGIEIINAEGAVVETRYYAQPLIAHYVDGHVEEIEDAGGFPGHGERDAFGAVSLDGGATWKRSNLSQSADLSSFKFKDGKAMVKYPGDVGRSALGSDGNQVLVVWVSRYAGGGNPAYAMLPEERELVAAHLVETGVIPDAAVCTDEDPLTPCPYLEDVFGVSGSQGYSDLADEGYPTVGILPFAAVWVSRGVVLPPEATGLETSSFVWFKAERLSSAKRDANRPEVSCVKGAGCVITWQEDPLGIRPGEGEGPGEGWAGAIAHHETDTWYSLIDWNNFSLVSADGSYGSFYSDTGDLATWVAENTSGSPSAAIPMAMPMRLTDNAMCTALDSDPYCFVDFDGSGTADSCAYTIPLTLETPVGTQDVDMCVAEDGRLMRGNTASTRARLGLHGYSSQCLYDPLNPEACPIDSAWFYMAYEESKGLGEEGEDETTPEDLIEKVDMGKNVWYHTFDMFTPELVSQGLMLNQPAVYPEDFTNPEGFLTPDTSFGYNFYQIDPDPVYETLAGLETTLYQAEISRRPSQISQDWYTAGESGTVAFQLWKQGIIRRGGPADIMARRFVMPITEGGTTTIYEYLTTTYELCTTAYEYLTIEQNCYWQEQWVDYEPNPAFKLNASCSIKPDQLKCYPYLDLDGNPTHDTGTITLVEVCDDPVETWEPVDYCELDDPYCEVTETCEATEFCDVGIDDGCKITETWEIVDTCDIGDPNCRETTLEEPTIDYLANPYDYANMVCENLDGTSGWAFTDGSNPRYVKGLCTAPAVNLSGNTILEGECGDAAACLDAFPFNEYYDDYQGGEGGTPAEGIARIWTWQQYGPNYGETTQDTTLTNLDDVSWDNPYDVAKGHRGFMSGDMVMAIYAWSPNWLANTVGHDNYNLYVRRSFDGGQTFSTLPGSFTFGDLTYSGDGTTTCEWMGPTGTETEYPVCVTYAAGEFEQARNVSQLVGSQETILDPRYTPTTNSITAVSVSTGLPVGFTAPLYLDDFRDPSRFFIIYETGDNTTVAFGEAEPLDLFASRAVDWGDDFLVWQDTADASTCLPSADPENTFDMTGFCNEFEALEGKALSESGEASVTASPGGMFFHAVWNQVDVDRDGNFIGSDVWFRRLLFLDDYIPPLE